MAEVITPRRRKERLEMIYGVGFPEPVSALGDGEEFVGRAKEWKAWLQARKQEQQATMRDKQMHWARHRLFRRGHQWISTRNGQEWRELNVQDNRVRAVFNLIGPALEFRKSLLQEQRPGFKNKPLPGAGTSGRDLAIAQQSVVEYYFHLQNVWELVLQAAVEAQTDGVCFLNVYIDRDGGPLLEQVELVSPEDDRYEGLVAQGYKQRESGLVEIPLTSEGDPAEVGEAPAKLPSGDIATRLLLAHQTLADPEAKSINGPDQPAKWFLVQRVRDLQSARIQLGDEKLEADAEKGFDSPVEGAIERARWKRGLPPFPTTRRRLHDGGVYENLVYLAPSREFPDGKWVEFIGDQHLKEGTLPGRCIPVARFTDGSSDRDLYPEPQMADWIGDQVAINGLGSRILEYARQHSGGRLLALEGTTIKETWDDIVGSVVEYRGPQPQNLPAPSVSGDLWNAWLQMIRRLEDKTGWNDVARGQLTGEGGFQDVAGRAILAARELFERQFGPMIRATARGASDWAELVVKYAQHLYETPRLIPVAGRVDLAKKITKAEIAGQCCVYVDPETLQPLPRALRNQLLTDYLDRGLITVEEYKQRAPFAEIRDLNMGDSRHWDRAQVMNTVLESRWEELEEMSPEELYGASTGLPIFWQDNVEVHLRALEEIIFDDLKPFGLRKIAADRWGIYVELGESKNFPQELELQGHPRPPAPAEVLGVPLNVAQLQEAAQRDRPDPEQVMAQAAGGGEVPGAAFAAGPAGEMSPTAIPNASQDRAEPLGAQGAAEAGLG